jgi:hypothetical protein
MSIEDLVIGREKVTAVFGSWPAFHDAEVVRIDIDRRPIGEGTGPTLDAMIHAFEISDEVASDGTLVLRNHVLVHLRFHEVVGLELGGVNLQNVLFGLVLTDIRDRQMEGIHLEVKFAASHGLEASFQCRRAEVVSLTPCDRDGTATTA